MAFADPIDGGVRGLDIEVALQVPHDAQLPHGVRAAQVQDLVDDLIGRLVRVVMGASGAEASGNVYRVVNLESLDDTDEFENQHLAAKWTEKDTIATYEKSGSF